MIEGLVGPRTGEGKYELPPELAAAGDQTGEPEGDALGLGEPKGESRYSSEEVREAGRAG